MGCIDRSVGRWIPVAWRFEYYSQIKRRGLVSTQRTVNKEKINKRTNLFKLLYVLLYILLSRPNN